MVKGSKHTREAMAIDLEVNVFKLLFLRNWRTQEACSRCVIHMRSMKCRTTALPPYMIGHKTILCTTTERTKKLKILCLDPTIILFRIQPSTTPTSSTFCRSGSNRRRCVDRAEINWFRNYLCIFIPMINKIIPFNSWWYIPKYLHIHYCMWILKF